MWSAIQGWMRRVYHQVRSPYEIDRGPFGEKGWQAQRPVMAVGDTSMSFQDLNRGRTVLGEFPSTKDGVLARVSDNPVTRTGADSLEGWAGG